MNNDVLTNINDDSLRMTLTIIEMISQNPGQYSLSDIGSLLHIDVYDVRRILANILCDMGGIFVLTNGDAIADSTQIMDANSKYGNATTKLSLISKYELTDLNGKNQFEELRR